MFSLRPIRVIIRPDKKTVQQKEDIAPDIAQWKCDEGSGGTLTDSINNFDATLTGVNWTAATGRGTKPKWNGSTAKGIVTADAAFSIHTLEAVTVTAWAYLLSDGSEGVGHVFNKLHYAGANANKGYNMWFGGYIPAGVQLKAEIGYDGTMPISISTAVIQLNEWVHVAMTYDHNGDKKVYLYKNGVEMTYDQQPTATGNLYDDTATDGVIGNDVEYNLFAPDGYLDDVRIYGRKLTGAQILAIHDATK